MTTPQPNSDSLVPAIGPERLRGVNQLALVARAPAAAEPQRCVLLTLRVDFIGRCGELMIDDAGLCLDRVAYDEAHRVFMAQLDPSALTDIIVEPAHCVGLEFEAGLAERMLADVQGEPGALPLLEDALESLWEKRDGRRMTQSAYDALGGAVGALQKRADTLVDGFCPAEREVARRLFTNLVAVADDTAPDTRLRVPLAELLRPFSAAAAVDGERVLKALVEARLLAKGRALPLEKTPARARRDL